MICIAVLIDLCQLILHAGKYTDNTNLCLESRLDYYSFFQKVNSL